MWYIILLISSIYIQEGASFTKVIPIVILGILLILGLIFYEIKIDYGILDKKLFKNPVISIGNASGFLIHLSQMATLIPIIFYMQSILEYSTSKTGIMLALQPLFMGSIAPISGWYRDRYGPFIPLLLGSFLCALSMIFIAFLSEITWTGILLHFILFGVGMGFFQAINNVEIMSATPSAKTSLSGSILALIRYLGMIFGIGLVAWLAGDLGFSINNQDEMGNTIKNIFLLSASCSLYS